MQTKWILHNKRLNYRREITWRASLANSCRVSRGMRVRKLSNSKSDLQGHRHWCHSIGHIWFPISLPFWRCLSCTVDERIITYFPKFQEVTWLWTHPFRGIISCMHEHSSVSTRNMVGAHQNLNGSRDLSTPLSGMVCYSPVSTCYDELIYQIWSL